MKMPWAIFLALTVFSVLVAAVYFAPGHRSERPRGLFVAAEWQRMVNPGELSKAHAFLDHNCQACHTPIKGVEASTCIACHANNEWVLERQPTAFHADIGQCHLCHGEHAGRTGLNTRMDHGLIAQIGLEMLEDLGASDDEAELAKKRLRRWLSESAPATTAHSEGSLLTSKERILNCFACHENDDRHFGLFGESCASCHSADRWSIHEYRHPSANSRDCAQCHQAPPSHYMKHFKMISATVAGQPHARVDQCFVCHQTTSWDDIKRVGRYKHH